MYYIVVSTVVQLMYVLVLSLHTP